MRIDLLNQYYAPDEAATAQLLTDVGEGLAAAGHQVRAICSNRSYAEPLRTYPRRERRNGVAIRRLPCTGFGRGRGRILDYLTFFAAAGAALAAGPRPDVVPYEEYQPWQRRRFEALPGMTGLWQVSGKNETTFDEMVRLDIAYVEQRSFWLDLRILLRTVPTIARQCLNRSHRGEGLS